MSEKIFDIYLEFNYKQLNLSAFNKINGNLEYYKEQTYENYYGKFQKIDFEKLNKILEDNIRQLEKSIDEFVKEVNIIIETPQSISVKFSVNKNNEGNKIIKDDATYLIQDAKQQVLKFYKDFKILHIIVEKYVLDNNHYEFLTLNQKCNKFSLDLKFICFPKNFIKNFEILFSKQHILINQFVCSNYIQSFNFNDKEKNICQKGRNIVEGINKQEVVSVPKEHKKKGFFEKLFHFFK
tara:strand:+ start:506 stop:1219 length:714 start_codon:yes stop_codon:yes gene_type:complete